MSPRHYVTTPLLHKQPTATTFRFDFPSAPLTILLMLHSPPFAPCYRTFHDPSTPVTARSTALTAGRAPAPATPPVLVRSLSRSLLLVSELQKPKSLCAVPPMSCSRASASSPSTSHSAGTKLACAQYTYASKQGVPRATSCTLHSSTMRGPPPDPGTKARCTEMMPSP